MAGRALGFLACVATVFASMSTRAEEEKARLSTISVAGRGKISALPDLAEINVGVATQAPTAQQALAANSEAMATLQALLKERGVAAKDIQTTQIQVNPQYSQPRPQLSSVQQAEFVPRIVGYRVDNSVQVTSRQIAKLGTLLDALVQAGANQVHGIQFRVDEPEKLLDEARKRAMTDARRKAEQLAGEAGVVLGTAISIREEGASMPPPMPYGSMPGMGMMAAERSVPVAAGEQEISVSVQVIYEMKGPK